MDQSESREKTSEQTFYNLATSFNYILAAPIHSAT